MSAYETEIAIRLDRYRPTDQSILFNPTGYQYLATKGFRD